MNVSTYVRVRQASGMVIKGTRGVNIKRNLAEFLITGESYARVG